MSTTMMIMIMRSGSQSRTRDSNMQFLGLGIDWNHSQLLRKLLVFYTTHLLMFTNAREDKPPRIQHCEKSLQVISPGGESNK